MVKLWERRKYKKGVVLLQPCHTPWTLVADFSSKKMIKAYIHKKAKGRIGDSFEYKIEGEQK